jgi:F0F1-type ATP synthase membrane subunit b/b'
MAPPESRSGSASSRPDTRTFDRLIAHWREHEQQLADLARQADSILEDYEARARDEAEKILIDARLEAARIISNARAQVAELTEQIQALTRTQRDAAAALEQTRKTLESALGNMSRSFEPAPPTSSAPPSSAPPSSPPPSSTPPPSPPTSTFAPGSPRPTFSPAPTPTPKPPAPTPAPAAPVTPPSSQTTAASPAPAPPASPGTVSSSFLAQARGQSSRPMTLLSLDDAVRSIPEVQAAAAPAPRRFDAKASLARYKRGVIATVVVLASLGLAWVVATTWLGSPSEIIGSATTSEVTGVRSGGGGTPAARATPVSVTLEARRPTWLRATVDGKGENGRLLEKGQRRTIDAQRDVVIRVGDAGALLVSLNGASATRLGRDGEVVTRRFGAEGAERSARSEASAEVDESPSRSAQSAVRTTGSATQAPSQLLSSQRSTAVERTTSAPAALPGSTGRAQSPAGASVEQQILSADRQWFDSFYEKDRSTMSRLSAPGLEIVDTRPNDAKAPSAQPPERQLKDVRVDVHGDGAVMSGRMIERVVTGEKTEQRDAFISEVWVRRDGTWQLLGLRLAPADEVGGSSRSLR